MAESNAFQVELFKKLDALDLLKLGADKKVNRTKWVFNEKRDGEDNVIRHKARLVAKGFSQVLGVYFKEVLSTAAAYITVRLILTISVYFGGCRSMIDVESALVNAPLKEKTVCRTARWFRSQKV